MDAKTFSSAGYKKMPVLTLQKGGFAQKNFISSKQIQFQKVLNLIHGADGEDATIAALFDFYNINYIGPRKDTSVMSFDKFLTKAYAQACHVDTVSYELRTGERKTKIPVPFIIKPHV